MKSPHLVDGGIDLLKISRDTTFHRKRLFSAPQNLRKTRRKIAEFIEFLFKVEMKF